MPNENYVIQNSNFVIYNSSFLATRIIDNYIDPCEFKIEIGFQFGVNEVSTNMDQTVAYNKLEFLIDNVLDKSIFVSSGNGFWNEVADKETRNNFLVLPGEPYDDLVTKALYYKIQAISFPAFMLVDMSVWSTSTRLKFNFVGEEKCTLPGIEQWLGELTYHDQPWWHRDDCDTRDEIPPNKKALDNPPKNSVNFNIVYELLNSQDPGEVVEFKNFKPTLVK